MSTFNKITDTVRESLDVLAEGWHDLWNKARHAITRFTPTDSEGAGANRWGLLSAELHEGDDSLTVSIEAPGLNKENFEIMINGQHLVVRGTKQAENVRTEGHYHITERAYGRFERAFTLPVEVDQDGTRANYKGGVLSITMPKSSRAQRRVIPIH